MFFAGLLFENKCGSFLELDLSVGRCWANILAQVCQPALLSVQSFIPFLARITNYTIWAVVYLLILTKTDMLRLGARFELGIQESFCWLLFIKSLASSLHVWYISFAAMAWYTGLVSPEIDRWSLLVALSPWVWVLVLYFCQLNPSLEVKLLFLWIFLQESIIRQEKVVFLPGQ